MFSGCVSTADSSAEYTLHEHIEQFIAQSGGFSGAVLVMQGGKVIFGETFGVSNPETLTYITLDTPFPIMDPSKMLTATAILLLEMDGKLDTSDTLDNFVSGHDNLRYLSVSHLLSKNGGFGGSTPFMRNFIADADYVRNMTPLEFEPYVITHWRGGALDVPYASMDYWVLGRVIEQTSGMAYEEFIQTRIFEPLGMENSGFLDTLEAIALPLQIPIHFQDTWLNLERAEHFPFFLYYSFAGIVTSANDFALWMDAFFSGKLFPEYMLGQINNGNFNYGWMFHDSGLWYYSEGGFFGGNVVYCPDSDTKIIVLSNLSSAWNLANFITKVVLGISIY